jgi:hypothetical protein
MRWKSIAKFLTISLIAGNNLTVRQEITGLGPEIRLGYLFAIALVIWVWWIGTPQWLPARGKSRNDRIVGLLVGLLILSTVSGTLILGILNLPSSFFTAMGVIVLYSATLYTLIRLYTIDELLDMYVKVVKWAVIVAGVQQLSWLFFKLDTTGWVRAIGFTSRFGGEEGWFVRVSAWWQEPAHLAQFLLLGVLLVVLPLPDSLSKILKLTRLWRIGILVTFALTFSTSAIPVVLFIMLAYAWDRRRQWMLIVICALVALWVMGSHTITERLQSIETVNNDLADSNLSLWAVASNFLASVNNLSNAPLGLGVGNHIVAYEAWLRTIGTAGLSIDQLYINSRDGGSMITRLLSEFGLPSLIIWIYLIFRAVTLVVRGQIRSNGSRFVEYVAIAALFTLCLRQGSYSMFDPWFFLLLMLRARRIESVAPENRAVAHPAVA